MNDMRRIRRGLVGSVITVAAMAAPALGQVATQPAVERAAALVDSLFEAQGLPGVSVAIGVDGKIVWSRGFGAADRASNRPVTTTTMFRIGSVSKSLTAAGLVRLAEQGRLDIDAPVQRYVPSFPEKRWPITTRQLAGHLAGVRHYRNNEFLMNRAFASVPEALSIFADDTLLFEPGTRYSYSSYGWNLISAVMESASGRDFLSYMHNVVWEPLGMRHTAPDRVDSLIPNRATPYSRMWGAGPDASLIEGPPVNNSYKWAGGGFLSTPEDLIRFAFAHLEPGFHRASSLELLFTSQRNNSGDEIGYGIGWRVGIDAAGRRRWGHGGGSVGGTTQLLIYPDERVVVAIVSNLGRVRYGDVSLRLAELFMPRDP